MSDFEEIDRDQAVSEYGDDTVEALESEFKTSHGSLADPTEFFQVKIHRFPEALCGLGRCCQINYLADKGDGEVEYWHKFEEPLPVLAYDARGQLWIVGGRYTITEDGIEG